MATTDILVLGATGFTGRLITRYLSTHPQRSSPGFTFTLAARSKSKLDDLLVSLGLGENEDINKVVLDVTSESDIEAVVRRVKVVINTVGPYWKWGTGVVRACVRNGVHYVDLTGETPWIRDIIDEFDYVATKTHACIIPSCGMESVPSDLSVYLSCLAIHKLAPGSPIDSSTTAFSIRGGISGGTLSTVTTMFEEVPQYKLEASQQDYALCPGASGPRLPGPKLVYSLPNPASSSNPAKIGAFSVLSPVNKATVQRTWALLEMSKGAHGQSVRYGPQFKYDEFIVMPYRWAAVLVSLSFLVVHLAMTWLSPIRWLFKKLAPPPGTGPSDEAMENGFFKCYNVTSSVETPTSPAIHTRTTIQGKGDPGYLLTAIMISESALSLLPSLNNTSKAVLPALAKQGGVLTPTSALADVLIERLAASGKFEFESLILDGEDKKTR